MDLERLRASLERGTGTVFDLDPGVHDVTAPLVIRHVGVELRGAAGDVVLRRGRHADGTLFDGPLLSIAGCSAVRLSNLVIDGRRFETRAGRTVDNRHPLDADPASAEFACGSVLPSPQCHDPLHYGSSIAADVLVGDATKVIVDDLLVRDPITIGIAIGPGSHDIRMHRVTVLRAGQFGLWIGAALPVRPPLPLPAEMGARLPSGVLAEDCAIERSGAAGISIEGRDVELRRTTLRDNHCDFPFNDNGGQLVIDYKSDGVRLDACTITGESALERSVFRADVSGGRLVGHVESFAAVGIEASGTGLSFVDTVISGVAREAIHFDGARGVLLSGGGTRLTGNHLAARRGVEPWCNGPRHNITITNSAAQLALGAKSGDIRIEDIHCEDGILVWSDGSVPGLRIDGLRLRGNALGPGPDGGTGGVAIGLDRDGQSLRGADWRLDPAPASRD